MFLSCLSGCLPPSQLLFVCVCVRARALVRACTRARVCVIHRKKYYTAAHTRSAGGKLLFLFKFVRWWIVLHPSASTLHFLQVLRFSRSPCTGRDSVCGFASSVVGKLAGPFRYPLPIPIPPHPYPRFLLARGSSGRWSREEGGEKCLGPSELVPGLQTPPSCSGCGRPPPPPPPRSLSFVRSVSAPSGQCHADKIWLTVLTSPCKSVRVTPHTQQV